ncbi:MAG TPA: glycosyltransferase family 39 protein [Solirubrobacteraceae bacterium]|nr:glycosyltransferase family 39 protein [Solirubrobacteraceae bacterium]
MSGGVDVAAPVASAQTRTVPLPLLRLLPWAVGAITVAAAVLRFAGLSGVGPNTFYDAAVRSMGMSLHNFFFGAFDPRAFLAIDKPPLDLWLQVLSVKVFGWGSFALKLPEALAGTLAVPLLYDAVRRAVGAPAGLAAAAVLALAPESVLTARSDTMDSVMMLLVIVALWLTIRACSERPSRRLLVLAGVALGLAFNVKLLEAVLALPGLTVLYLLGADRDMRKRIGDLVRAGAAFVGVGLSWAILVTIAPGSHPWAVGSTNGSVWDAMFVFNGVGRGSASGSTTTGGPGLLRLLVPSGWHFNQLFGSVLFAAFALGIAGALTAVLRERHEPAGPRRLPHAFAIAITVWIAFSVLLFDGIGTMHTRYMEALSPALAVAIGWGAVTLAGAGRRATPAVPALVAALLCICFYAGGLHPDSISTGALALLIATIGAARIAHAASGSSAAAARWLTGAMILTTALAFPVHESVLLARTHANDSGGLATVNAKQTTALSSFLTPRTSGIRYELAVDDPLKVATLIISDQRAILPLTPSFGGHALISVAQLRADIAAGQVRYALVAHRSCATDPSGKEWCTRAARWIRSHGVNVSNDAGLTGASRLYRLVGESS